MFYNIRTVTASSREEAIKKVESGDFCESDAMCDTVHGSIRRPWRRL